MDIGAVNKGKGQPKGKGKGTGKGEKGKDQQKGKDNGRGKFVCGKPGHFAGDRDHSVRINGTVLESTHPCL